MQTTPAKKIVYFLPYLPIDEEIHIGNILFWPFYRMQERFITEETVRKQLETLFACYVNREGDSTRSITIVSIGDRDFSAFSKNDLADLDSAVKILAIASMIKNYYGFQYRNSENFQVHWQEFVPGEDTLTVLYRLRRKAYDGYSF